MPVRYTEDGSLTLFDEDAQQTYHNQAGACGEALMNYIMPSGALSYFRKHQSIRLLDVCYGLGYNTWILLDQLLTDELAEDFIIEITAIESNPSLLEWLPKILHQPCFSNLESKIPKLFYYIYNFVKDFQVHPATETTLRLRLAGNQRIRVHYKFTDIRRVASRLSGNYQIIFHDPFSPDKMPELWTVDLFHCYNRLLDSNGRIITYSAAGAVRGGMIEAGFHIYKTPALGKKTGGTAALKSAIHQTDTLRHEHLLPLNDTEQAFLKTRASIPYRDPDLRLSREQIMRNRLEEQLASNRPSAEALRTRLSKG